MQIPFVSAVRIEALQRPVDPEASYLSKPDRIFQARLKMTYLGGRSQFMFTIVHIYSTTHLPLFTIFVL